MNFSSVIRLILSLILPTAVAVFSGIITAGEIRGWYEGLNHPAITPANGVFGPVWTILFFLMGWSFYMIWNLREGSKRAGAFKIFYIQLLLNFLWTVLFFYLHQMALALLDLLVLWYFVFLMIRKFSSMNPVAAWLNYPYLAWLTFAAILNLAFLIVN